MNLPVKLHAVQLSNYGGAALAARYGALSADHLEYLDEAGVAELARNSTVAVLLPGAYFVLNETQLPPVSLLRQYDVPTTIAADCNPGSSPFLSIQLAASMGCDLSGLSTEEALRGITSNAARALGITQTSGSLELRKHADSVVCDISEPAEALNWLGGTSWQRSLGTASRFLLKKSQIGRCLFDSSPRNRSLYRRTISQLFRHG